MTNDRPHRNKALVAAASVFAVSLLVYGWTLAPTVTLVDSGELIVAARFLGVAHPPGFPLYLVLAHLASLVPFGNIAERINFASAIFAALAAGMLVLIVVEMIGAAGSEPKPKGRPKKETRPERSWVTIMVPAVCSGLLVAFSKTLWSYATIAEVYTLNTLLVLVIILLMLRWRRRVREGIEHADRLLYVAAALFGLALGVHHVTIAMLLPALAVLVYRSEGFSFFRSRRFLFAALLSFSALVIVNCYLPWAASRSPVLNWGNPRSLQTIWWHITGRQYQAFVSFAPAMAGQELSKFAGLILREFGLLPLAPIFAVFGCVSLFKRDRTAFWSFLLIVICNLVYGLGYDIAEDKDAYYLLTFISVAIAAGFGLWESLERIRADIRRELAVVLFLVPAIALVTNWAFNNRSKHFVAHDYVDNIQSTIEPNGLLLTIDWQVASPMLYTREVEQLRRDIKAIDVQLLRRSWYFDQLQRDHPDLVERSRDKIDVYLAELRKWEQDPALYKKNAALSQRINELFVEMIQSIVTREFDAGPVYVTAEMILLRQGRDINIINWLNQTFQAVPRGLLFQLARDREFHDPGEPVLQMRGLTDGTLRFSPDDVVTQKVIPIYKAMFESRGRYLGHFDQRERADAAIAQARRFERQ